MKVHVTREQVSRLAWMFVLCGVWFLIGWFARGWLMGSEVILVEQARQVLLSEEPGEMPTSRELTHAAIRGMLERTDDSYAALFEPDISRRYADDLAGQSGITGLVAAGHNGELVVGWVMPGGSADRAGLRVDDTILSVDGVEIDDSTTELEASLLIRGPLDVPAHFVVKRGGQVLEFDVMRQERPVVSTQMLEGGIAYLAQHVFTENAPQKTRAALQDLLAQKPTALILDLRGNSGGSMDATQAVLSDFIKDGLLFTAELKGGQRRPFQAQGEGLATDVPLVVLIDGSTYSSAETAAAALKERGRGILIGSATYGKGMIQTTVSLSEDHMLHFSIAKWLSPDGHWYEKIGVAPDIVAKDDSSTEDDEVLQFAVNYVREMWAP